MELVRTIDIYCNKASIAVPFLDIKEIINITTLPVYAQHVDYRQQGKGTGYIIPEELEQTGAVGSLLNHSEHKISFQQIKKTGERCNELGLKLIICTSTLKETQSLIKFKPYAIAFEDSTLIASGKSITSSNSRKIKKFVSLFSNLDIIPLCGAGIITPEDVKKSIYLGYKGVLVSSVVANSPHPEKFLKDISGLF